MFLLEFFMNDIFHAEVSMFYFSGDNWVINGCIFLYIILYDSKISFMFFLSYLISREPSQYKDATSPLQRFPLSR